MNDKKTGKAKLAAIAEYHRQARLAVRQGTREVVSELAMEAELEKEAEAHLLKKTGVEQIEEWEKIHQDAEDRARERARILLRELNAEDERGT